ncbi:hypothetical protein [Companilactobacillus zhachilii]|uniref:hypothetical protein n=1 Tax=Companilactobacillus zhachilii TaxID=2304606 RepID=UPI004033E948
MKAKDLIHELEKFDQENDVAIYNPESDHALIISMPITQDPEYSDEIGLDSRTIYISGDWK